MTKVLDNLKLSRPRLCIPILGFMFFYSSHVLAQEISITRQNNDSTSLFATTMFDCKAPDKMKENPAFSIGLYAFFPDLKKIGLHSFWIHPYSSVGYKAHYIAELENVDYDSFEVLNLEFCICKDKNGLLYRKDIGTNIRINTKNNFWESDLEIIEDNKLLHLYRQGIYKTTYPIDEIISDIAFKRNDSVFIYNYFHQSNYAYFPDIFDVYPLKHINGALYQDNKNLYRLMNGAVETIEDEQIEETIYFDVYEEEKRKPKQEALYVGKKNIYKQNNKLYNSKLKSSHFFTDSFYYFYNDILYYFDWHNNNDFQVDYQSGTNVIGFSEFKEDDYLFTKRDYTKAKPLGKDMLVHDNELFYKTNRVSYPEGMNLAELEYVGEFPFRLNIELVSNNISLRQSYAPIVSYEGQKYFIGDKNGKYILVPLNRIREPEKRKEYINLDLDHLHFYNEYYFGDGKTLYCNADIRNKLRYDIRYEDKTPYLTNKNIDFDNLTFWGRYFTDGKKLYYNYVPVDYTTKYKTDARGDLMDIAINKPTNKYPKLTFLNFEKLKPIEGTDYLTDEKYLIYKHIIVGEIDYSTIKIYNKQFIEDATRYYNAGQWVNKDVLGIKIHK